MEELKLKNNKLGALGISIGSSLLRPGVPFELSNLIKEADINMYAVKQGKEASTIS